MLSFTGNFQVAFLLEDKNCVNQSPQLCGIIHFPLETPENSMKSIKNIRSLDDLFPDKFKNLNGHRFQILTGECTISGIVDPMFREFTTRLNSTYEQGSPIDCANIVNVRLFPLRHLVGFPLPYRKLHEKLTSVFSWNNYEIGVLVSSHKLHAWTRFQSFNRRWLVICGEIYLKVIFFNWFVLRRRGWDLFLMNDILAFSLAQSAPMAHKSNLRRGSRIIIGSCLFLNLIVIQVIQTNTFSDILLDLPDKSIKEFEDIQSRNISLFIDKATKNSLSSIADRFVMDVLHNATIINGSLWDTKTGHNRSAFVVDMCKEIHFLLNSAMNVNDKESEKFYALNGQLSTWPAMFVFDSESPFQDHFKDFYERWFESGIGRHWRKKIAIGGAASGFHHFVHPVSNQSDRAPPIIMHHLAFGFLDLSFGLLATIIAFILEWIFYMWQQKKQRKIESNNMDLVLQRIMVKYKHFLEEDKV